MTRQVVEYTDLLELFLLLFLLLCFVFYIFLYYFFKKYDDKIDIINNDFLERYKDILVGINILIEVNENILSNMNSLNELNERNQELALDLKKEHTSTQENLMYTKKEIEYIIVELIKEFHELKNLEEKNSKLLNILNRRIRIKPKKDNVP